MKIQYLGLSLIIASLTLQADIPVKKTLSESECIKKIYKAFKDSINSKQDKKSTQNRLEGLVTRYDKQDKPWELYKKVEDYAYDLGDIEVKKKARLEWYCCLHIEWTRIERENAEDKKRYAEACQERDNRKKEIERFAVKNIPIE